MQSTPDFKTVIVDFLGNTSFLPALEDGSTADSYGNVYKFVSVRYATMDNVNDTLSYSEYQDVDIALQIPGDKIYVDSDVSGLWKVYEKQDPYSTKIQLAPDKISDQKFGYQTVARNDGRSVVVSAPEKGQGTIHFLFRRERTPGTPFSVQTSLTMTENNNNTRTLVHAGSFRFNLVHSGLC